MANPNSTNTSELPGFTTLRGAERSAVMLRYEGKTYAQIANNINDEFGTTYVERTVNDWFIAGGKLEAAYHELLDAMAAQSLKEARQTIKRASNAAAGVLVDQLRSTNDPLIRQNAAKALLNKFVPDKQVVLDGPGLDEDLPVELAERANEIVAAAGGTDEPKPVDDAPDSPAPDQPTGPSSS